MKIIKLLVLVLFFSCNLASAQDTLYIYRAGIVVIKRAVSEIDSISFYKNQSTPVPESVSDIDGYVYRTIKIGNQIWMTENLKTTKYNDGSSIPFITDSYQWMSSFTGGYSWYNNDPSNKNVYGAIYNWLAVATGKLAPKGWHVPSKSEINTLATYLGGYSVAGSRLKESGNSHWYAANSDATNISGFTSLPGGYRSCETGDYHNAGMWGVFWSSDEILTNGGRFIMSYDSPSFEYNSDRKNCGFSVRCIKDTLSVPVVVTLPVMNVTTTSAVCSGRINFNGGTPVTTRGICWSTRPMPTVANSKTSFVGDSTSFECRLTELKTDSTYYVRAYASNNIGTAYGNQVSFKTSSLDTVAISDIDGNTYHTLKIGNQTWMLENLKTTKYNDGTPIPYIIDGYQWITLTGAGFSWYNNDQLNKNIYGALYNWFTVNTGKLAPLGWHVPSPAEINTLTTYLGGNSVAGSKLKQSGNEHWVTENGDATNTSGFTALPGGYRSCETGDYHNSGMWGVFWSSNDTLTRAGRFMMTNDSPVFDYNSDRKNCGFSVRCIKDTSTVPVIVTLPVTGITYTSAVCGGKITSNGGAAVTTRGICWSKTTQPTLLNYKTIENGDSTLFNSVLNDLGVDSTYYVRAYATNVKGTAYGEQVSFKTLKPDSLTIIDRNGNIYHSIKIGNQTWMLENLKTTKYNDGSSISFIPESYQWITSSVGGYSWYNNDQTNKNNYGALYNWFAVNTGKLAPLGWHVPTPAEINTLTTYLGGNSIAGSKLKESGSDHWLAGNSEATNESGFTALPGGYRSCETGDYHNAGTWGVFWSSNDNLVNAGRFMMTNDSPVFDSSSDRKNCGFSVRCIKDTATVPVIVTVPVTGITFTSAVSGGKIISNGGTPVTASGICWSKTTQPTLLNYKTIEKGDSTSFTSTLTDLDADSTYYVRAYATNNKGTAYGEQISFKTLKADSLTVTDIDGNVYHVITIGTQTWMSENLKTTRFNDSISIPLVTDPSSWARLTTPGYCWYNNDSITFKNTVGTLYNWYAVNTGKLAPAGWHVASDEEWETLTNFLGIDEAGGKLKETGTLNWTAPNTGATNMTDFTALPGGGRGNDTGTFEGLGIVSFWWTSTVLDETYSRFRSVGYNNSGVGKSGSGKDNGLYVRCIKD